MIEIIGLEEFINIPQVWQFSSVILHSWVEGQRDTALEERARISIVRSLYDMYTAWIEHPLFEEVNTEYSNAWNPVAVQVIRHEPGVDQLEESYLISNVQDHIAPQTIKWVKRALGEPVKIIPIEPHVPVHPQRQLFISHSFKGAGLAFNSRLNLRGCVPKRYGAPISHARTFRARQKWSLRDFLREEENYNKVLKDELAFRKWVDYCGEKLDGLSQYIEIRDFWKCATGQVHPYDVEKLIKKHSRQWHTKKAKELNYYMFEENKQKEKSHGN